MEFTFGGRIRNAWNAFNNRYPIPNDYGSYGGSYIRPDRVQISTRN